MTSTERTDLDADTEAAASWDWWRIAVYVVALLALLVVVWAIIEGGERDLWTTMSAMPPDTWPAIGFAR